MGPKAGVDSCGEEKTSPCRNSTPDGSLYCALFRLRYMIQGYVYNSVFIVVKSDIGFSQDPKKKSCFVVSRKGIYQRSCID